MTYKNHHQTGELVFRHTYAYYVEPLVSFTKSADQLLVNIPLLLKHVLQEPVSLYSMCRVPVSVDTDTYLGNSHSYSDSYELSHSLTYEHTWEQCIFVKRHIC